jgi:hypothetical protein
VTETAEKVTSVSDTTPSGIEILYEWEPKRQYRVRFFEPEGKGATPTGSELDFGWRVVPSVTTVLDCLAKGGLSWWGQEVGVEGVLELYRRDLLGHGALGLGGGAEARFIAINTSEGYQAATVDGVVDLLKKQKLTINHTLGKAAKRGTAVHDALEVWAKTGALPDAAMFPREEQGYVLGVAAFLWDIQSAEPVASEVMVGSLEHGFAGRYDIRFKTTEEHAVVVHRTPVKGPQYAVLKPGLYLADLKTSKDCYPKSHWRQLEAYEGASVECGYEPTDGRGVLLVGADGTYRFIRSKATYQDFLVVLDVYHSDEGLKK